MAGTGKSGPHNADINVVPMIDIVLVLLIIFMVVTPMLQKGIDVNLPPAENVAEKDERTSEDLVIGIKADGSLWLETDPVTPEELQTALASVIRATPFKPILVKGDRRVSYGEVRKVVLIAQEAGAKIVNIATEEKKKKDEA